MYLKVATLEDLQGFKPSPEDIAEAHAYGIDPSFPEPSKCVVIVHRGEVLAIGGNDGDQCWFVTSATVWRLNVTDKLAFRRLIMTHRDTLLLSYKALWNFVWVGNTSHIRFLKTIGAVFHDEFSDASRQFQLFTITGG